MVDPNLFPPPHVYEFFGRRLSTEHSGIARDFQFGHPDIKPREYFKQIPPITKVKMFGRSRATKIRTHDVASRVGARTFRATISTPTSRRPCTFDPVPQSSRPIG